MITSKKTHTLSLNTYATFMSINSLRKPFGGDDETEQGCTIHLTAEEVQQLCDAAPEVDFSQRIRAYNEVGYMNTFKGTAPTGYESNGIIRVMNIRHDTKKGNKTLELRGARSGDLITEDPRYRTAVNITLEVYDYNWMGRAATSLRLKEIKVLEA
jgi:hypothetical protein